MDIFAHALWAGVAVTMLRQRRAIAPRITPRVIAATVGLAVLPDLVHTMPLLGWWMFGDGSMAALRAYAIAMPGQEPLLPPTVQLLSHHLHCAMHSVLLAGAVTLVCYALTRSLWVPLLGWWLHIVIDVFTHSADYYPVAVLYPIAQGGFDGIAWNTPWFMALNYIVLGVVGLWLILKSNGRPPRE